MAKDIDLRIGHRGQGPACGSLGTATKIFLFVCACCTPAFAQSGCAQASPENPSVILGLLAGGVAALSLVWTRRRQQ